ncbi:MAG: hypothetical protein QM680_07250 [Luteolibacter sp.]
MMESRQFIHLRNWEAKWQFRRKLLLEIARLLEDAPDETWRSVSRMAEKLSSDPGSGGRYHVKKWRRFFGNTPAKNIETICRYFATDTPRGRRREKLQDLSDGTPFSGIVPSSKLQQMREDAYNEATLIVEEALSEP